jgi:hypothetical protein
LLLSGVYSMTAANFIGDFSVSPSYRRSLPVPIEQQLTLDVVVPSRTKPEIKSPAGHWPQLHAAIEAGADAVYFGLTHFTARAKAGFTLAELPEALRTLHRRGVKGYVTFNTLIFDNELPAAAKALAAIAEAGADAILVRTGQRWRWLAASRPVSKSTAARR